MEDLILEGIGLVITALIAWGANTLRRKTGIEIEAKHREALHSALLTGAKLALSKGLTGAAAVDLIGGWAKEAVPDALNHFGLNKRVDRLDKMAESKLEELIGINIDLPIDKLVTTDRLK